MASKGGRSSRTIAVLLTVSVSAALSACSVVLGVDANRYVAVDGGSSPWDCLGSPPEPLDPDLNVEVTVLVMNALDPSISAGGVDGGSDLDTVSGTFLQGVTVQACEIRDPTCAGAAAPMVVTPASGAAAFALRGDFAGFFALTRPDLVPGTLYPGNLLAGDTTVSVPVFEITPAGLTDLATAAGAENVALDAQGSLGHALITIYDCHDHQAAGVSVTYSTNPAMTSPTTFYFKGGIPSLHATYTDNFGLAGALNLPIGAVTATATIPNYPGPIGTISFFVRPGAITSAWVRVRSH